MATQDDIYRESQRTADAVGEATEALQDIAQDLEKARNNPTQDPETLKLLEVSGFTIPPNFPDTQI